MVLFTIGVFIAGLDNGIISVALTTISETFQVSPSWGAWSVTIYTLGVAMSVPIIGKLSDRYGRKRLFLMEILIFGIGSLCVAISPNFTFLIISRLVVAEFLSLEARTYWTHYPQINKVKHWGY